jgi:hypothetical protein
MRKEIAMANESLRATLNQALSEYALERGRILGKVQDCREALFDAESNHKRASEAERKAVFEDDELVRKMRELLSHYNSLPIDPPRPRALLEQHEKMGTEQLQTHRKRMAEHEAASEAYRVVEEAKRDLAVAEQDVKTIETRIQETTTEIQRLS